MYVVTCAQMKAIEQNSLRFGLSYLRLMENAGSAAAAFIRKTVPVDGKYCTVFCGKGNNGGDGFVVARRLFENGADVAVVLTESAVKTAEAVEMQEMLERMEIDVLDFEKDNAYIIKRMQSTDIVVDAVYGTGFKGKLSETARAVCRLINNTQAAVFSLDIPSGVDADTGSFDNDAVIADYTVVFDSMKPAHVLPGCEGFCGELRVADIGIPGDAKEEIPSSFHMTDPDTVFAHLKKRKKESHKGSYGKLLNIAGSQSYMGAAMLSTLAALRCGAGYVTLASTKEVCRTAAPSLMEAVFCPLKQDSDGRIAVQAKEGLVERVGSSTAVLIGCGLGQSEDVREIVYAVVQNATCPVILDADGINAVSQNINVLKQAKAPVIVTPHLGEMARLTGCTIEQIRSERYRIAKEFAQEYCCTVVLKDSQSCVVTPEGFIHLNTTGNAGLAKAGSGDVLAGMIGAFAAQGVKPEYAAVCGVYLHGAAGDMAALRYSQYAMLPHDVISQFSNLFLQYDR